MDDTCNRAKSTAQTIWTTTFFPILSSPINDDLASNSGLQLCKQYLDAVLTTDWIQTIRASLNWDFWKRNCFWTRTATRVIRRPQARLILVLNDDQVPQLIHFFNAYINRRRRSRVRVDVNECDNNDRLCRLLRLFQATPQTRPG